jgi:hypothetical protein
MATSRGLYATWTSGYGVLSKTAGTMWARSVRSISKMPNAPCISTTPFPEFENVPTIRSHDDLYQLSLKEPDMFWGKLARSRLEWLRDFRQVKDVNMSRGYIRWFLDGKINASGMYSHW